MKLEPRTTLTHHIMEDLARALGLRARLTGGAFDPPRTAIVGAGWSVALEGPELICIAETPDGPLSTIHTSSHSAPDADLLHTSLDRLARESLRLRAPLPAVAEITATAAALAGMMEDAKP